ncbi:MAG: hypothetical protein K0R50_317 [Eubacterium sp.]|nr:hypothetical protein [Eubacterium sp.]
MNLQLIRHATLLLSINKKTILIDPMLSPKGALEPVKNVANQSRNPLVDLPVSAEDLLTCDAVLITHTHRDHFDDAAACFLPKNKLIFCQPKDVEKINKSGFINVVPVKRHLNWEGISIARTPARHGHGATALGLAPVSGYVLCGPAEPTVYITGDSIFYCETKKALDKYKPNIVICNAGQAAFSAGRPITMGIEDIQKILSCSPGSDIVAVHMEAWNHCVLTRNHLKKYVDENNLQSKVHVPEDGEEIQFVK